MSGLSTFVLGATIKVTIVSAIALSAASMLRGRSAAVRHWVLAIAVGCAAVMPLLQFVVPAWQLRTVADAGGVLATIQDLPVAATAATAAHGPTLLERAAGAAGIVWLAGIAVGVAILVAGLTRLAWLSSGATRIVDGPWHDVAAELTRAYGLKRSVALLLSPQSRLLATWGFARPRIVLPASAQDWSEERARIVLGHELAHVQRNDWVVQMAVEALAAVYWFNPLVWMLRRRVNQESELAADDAVLGLGVNGGAYASELVDLARSLVASSYVPAPSMARPSSLERRIRAMLNGDLNRKPITWTACAVVVIALAAVTVPLAGFGGQSGPASFSGTLADQLGGVLQNVAITMTNTATGAKTDDTTDARGRFAFTGLTPGSYTVAAGPAGFAPLRASVRLEAGENVTRDITLPIGSLEETITLVSDGRPLASPPAPQPRRTPLSTPTYDPAKHRCTQADSAGCIEPPTKMADVKPVYPWSHRDTEGVVVLLGTIGTDGMMKTIVAQSAPGPDFAQAAVDAVAQWQFTPTYLDGQAVEVNMRVTINFKVQ